MNPPTEHQRQMRLLHSAVWWQAKVIAIQAVALAVLVFVLVVLWKGIPR